MIKNFAKRITFIILKVEQYKVCYNFELVCFFSDLSYYVIKVEVF